MLFRLYQKDILFFYAKLFLLSLLAFLRVSASALPPLKLSKRAQTGRSIGAIDNALS